MQIEADWPVRWDGLDTRGNPEQFASARVRADGGEIASVDFSGITENPDGSYSGSLKFELDVIEGVPVSLEWMVVDNEDTDGVWSDAVSFTYQDAGASKPTSDGEITATPKN